MEGRFFAEAAVILSVLAQGVAASARRMLWKADFLPRRRGCGRWRRSEVVFGAEARFGLAGKLLTVNRLLKVFVRFSNENFL